MIWLASLPDECGEEVPSSVPLIARAYRRCRDARGSGFSKVVELHLDFVTRANDRQLTGLRYALPFKHGPIRGKVAVALQHLDGAGNGSGSVVSHAYRKPHDDFGWLAACGGRGSVYRRSCKGPKRFQTNHPGHGSVGTSTRELEHLRPESSEEHWAWWRLDVKLAMHAHALTVDVRFVIDEQWKQYCEVFLHVGQRSIEAEPPPILDDRPVRYTQTEGEPTAKDCVNGEGLLGQRNWVTRMYGNNGCAEPDVDRGARESKGSEGIGTAAVRHPESSETFAACSFDVCPDISELTIEAEDRDVHGQLPRFPRCGHMYSTPMVEWP